MTARLPLLQSMAECGVYALSPYDECEFRCVYCITGVQGPSVPRRSPEEVVSALRQELSALPPEAHVAVGALCDAYPDREREHGVTRLCLIELVRQRRTFGVITKGTTVLRDTDVLTLAAATVTVSLCSVDERALPTVDPRAPTAASRLELIRVLGDRGVDVNVSAAPWIPGVTDAEALADAVGDEVPIQFAPLNVTSPKVACSPYGRRFSQAEINGRYVEARERFRRRSNVTWLFPIPTEPEPPRRHPFATLRRREPAAPGRG